MRDLKGRRNYERPDSRVRRDRIGIRINSNIYDDILGTVNTVPVRGCIVMRYLINCVMIGEFPGSPDTDSYEVSDDEFYRIRSMLDERNRMEKL